MSCASCMSTICLVNPGGLDFITVHSFQYAALLLIFLSVFCLFAACVFLFCFALFFNVFATPGVAVIRKPGDKTSSTRTA